jgi:hypothetical protein
MNNGVQRAIGRLEGKMESMVKLVSLSLKKIDLIEDSVSAIKASCPKCNDRSLGSKAKQVVAEGSFISVIVLLIELVMFLVGMR